MIPIEALSAWRKRAIKAGLLLSTWQSEDHHHRKPDQTPSQDALLAPPINTTNAARQGGPPNAAHGQHGSTSRGSLSSLVTSSRPLPSTGGLPVRRGAGGIVNSLVSSTGNRAAAATHECGEHGS